MKFTLIFLVVIGLAAVGFWEYVYVPGEVGPRASDDWNRIRVGDKILNLEVARSLIDRQRGLSGREPATFPSDTGMLFVFGKPGLHEFWMKDMKFPIDIIWLDENLKVIDIKEWAEPASYYTDPPQNFVPQDLAQYVLETNAGFAESARLKIGTQAEILK